MKSSSCWQEMRIIKIYIYIYLVFHIWQNGSICKNSKFILTIVNKICIYFLTIWFTGPKEGCGSIMKPVSAYFSRSLNQIIDIRGVSITMRQLTFTEPDVTNKCHMFSSRWVYFTPLLCLDIQSFAEKLKKNTNCHCKYLVD